MKACPQCGAELKDNVISCKECGSDSATGWSDSSEAYSLGVDPDFDYEEARADEFEESGRKKPGPGWVAVTGFILILAAILFYLI
jgi:uncharacterized membrane protein YvbJ